MSGRLSGKVAVITGSTSGIGRATAELFAHEGASVVVSGRREELGQEVVEGIRAAGGTATYCHTDVSEPDQIRALIDHAVETYGSLHVLMNNAFSGPRHAILELSEEEWDESMDVGLKAVFLGCKYAIPHMISAGGGSIINTSSVHGVLAARDYSPYDGLKAAMINLTRQIAVDYGHQGVRANCVCPGAIVVERSQQAIREHPERLRRAEVIYPVGRIGYPIDVANAALFLASDESSFITGHALMVDGGLTIQLQESVASVVSEHIIERGGW